MTGMGARRVPVRYLSTCDLSVNCARFFRTPGPPLITRIEAGVTNLPTLIRGVANLLR